MTIILKSWTWNIWNLEIFQDGKLFSILKSWNTWNLEIFQDDKHLEILKYKPFARGQRACEAFCFWAENVAKFHKTFVNIACKWGAGARILAWFWSRNWVSLRKRGVQKVLALGAGWAVLEIEFWHVFEHVIEYVCEKDVFKNCWHGELVGQFWRSSFGMLLST